MNNKVTPQETRIIYTILIAQGLIMNKLVESNVIANLWFMFAAFSAIMYGYHVFKIRSK